MNLNQVTLPAKDIEESKDFYLELGFKMIVNSPHYARYETPTGDSTFSIHSSEAVPTQPSAIIYFESDFLDKLVDSLKQKGFVFETDPTDMPWLWREAKLLDPSGNIICLYHAGENRKNPPWRTDQKN